MDSQPAGPEVWNGRMLWGPGRLIYMGSGGAAESHRHHAVQLVVSFDDPFELDIEGRMSHPRAALIPRDVHHAVQTSGRRIALVLIEPHGPAGAGIARRAIELDGNDLTEILPARAEPPDRPDHITGFADELLRALDPSPRRQPAHPLPDAVLTALDYLDDALPERPALDAAARAAHMSPSRLTHLFTAEVGVPFRRFVLWLRLRRAALAMAETGTLTEAAAAAGFSDQAHLSRVCREMFGVNPSAAIRMQVLPLIGGARSAATFKTSGTALNTVIP